MKNKNYAFKLNKFRDHIKKDRSFPIVLVIRKNSQRKMIGLGISAHSIEKINRNGNVEILSQWNESFQRYELDGRKNLHPDRDKLNNWLNELDLRCREIISDFEKKKIDWTLNQFEEAFINKAKKTGIENYFLQHIDKLKKSGKIGNKICYQRTLDMLKLYDSKMGKRIFSEIDLKYVNGFHNYLQVERHCVGNTIKYYMKTLRSLLNKAIKEGEASISTYPFGKYGYSIAELEQETKKRYLPNNYIDVMKTSILHSYPLNWCRNIFLFSYYCQGMSFIDVANLTNHDIIMLNDGKYISYRRTKTESKNSKFIQIKIDKRIQDLLDWFRSDTHLIGNYLAPIISIDGYEGEQLYAHIRNRYKKYNDYLKELSEALKFEGIKLSSYMSRHSYAMRLKNSGISEDVISEALGHKDLATTRIYLDSFGNDEIAKANEVL